MKLGFLAAILGFSLIGGLWLVPGCVLLDEAPAGTVDLVAAVAQLRADLAAAKGPAATAIPGAAGAAAISPELAALAKFTDAVTAALAKQPAAATVIGGTPSVPWWRVLAEIIGQLGVLLGGGIVLKKKIVSEMKATASASGANGKV